MLKINMDSAVPWINRDPFWGINNAFISPKCCSFKFCYSLWPHIFQFWSIVWSCLFLSSLRLHSLFHKHYPKYIFWKSHLIKKLNYKDGTHLKILLSKLMSGTILYFKFCYKSNLVKMSTKTACIFFYKVTNIWIDKKGFMIFYFKFRQIKYYYL